MVSTYSGDIQDTPRNCSRTTFTFQGVWMHNIQLTVLHYNNLTQFLQSTANRCFKWCVATVYFTTYIWHNRIKKLYTSLISILPEDGDRQTAEKCTIVLYFQ